MSAGNKQPDSPHMMRAIDLATQALHITSPNPRVGCVIVAPSGIVIGEGHTQKAGGPHAEIMALRHANSLGYSTEGATAYVTLEPCSHHGRTGPCCDALSTAGIKKVVASIADPNPLVSGNGFNRLRANGIEVEIGSCADQSRALNIGFFSRMIRKTPWVRTKMAASLDGKTALTNGISQWISSEESRNDVQHWRARSCAVLTGMGTLRQDDPLLNVRIPNTQRQPHLVVIDSRLETSLGAQLWNVDREVFIYAAVENPDRQRALEQRGAQVIYLPDVNNKVDLKAVLCDLALREINEVHVEAGHVLNGSLLQQNLIDEFVLYLSPMLLGKGRGMFDMEAISTLGEAIQLEFLAMDRIGPDLRIVSKAVARDNF